MIAFVGMIVAIVIKTYKQNPIEDIIKRSLDLITIAVPPALPGALTAGLIYSQNRLRKQKIYCISPRTINICGSLNTFVFDKTGTLTEDGLDLKCVLTTKPDTQSIHSRCFDQAMSDVNEFNADNFEFLESMASCHSITRIHGELAGDPLDCKMFEFTKWELVEPTIEETKLFNMLVPTIVYPNSRFNANGVRCCCCPYDLSVVY
jgi:cation-transporting ATPase 13A3/4/5